MKRLLVSLAVTALAAALVAGHLWYWYAPRPRPARPDADSVVAGLLGDPRFPAVLWLPYPHQNLGALDPAAPAHQQYLAACARLSGLPPPVLPSFGGFPVVPARELAVAADEGGERFVVMARVYPLLAMFSRLAGRLANNAWLAGGPVTVEGRAAEVRWEGNHWIVQEAGAAPLEPAPLPAGAKAARALAVLHLREDADPFPADVYRLVAEDRGLVVRSATELGDGLWRHADALTEQDLVFLTLAGPGSPNGVQGLAFFRRDRTSTELPRAATLAHLAKPPADPWRVPGGSLAGLAGALRDGEASGFALAAIGDPGLATARNLAPLAAAVTRADAATSPGQLNWGLWADLVNTESEVARLDELARRLPLLAPRQARRFRDAHTVIGPVAARFGRLVVVVSSQPPALRLELQRRHDDASPAARVD